MSTTLTIETERRIVNVENNVFDVRAEITRNVVNVNPSPTLLAVDQTVYTHIQATPSTLWTVAHNLGRYPSVTVMLPSGEEVEALVTHVDQNNSTIELVTATVGRASFN